MEQEVIDRFWSKVDKNGPVHPRLGTPCWLWTAGRVTGGYGGFKVGGKQLKAHRFLYESINGALAKELVVRHECDNPACVRPEHLIAGSVADNNADMVIRGRARYPGPKTPARGATHGFAIHPEAIPRGERNGTAKLSEADVTTCRHRFTSGQCSIRALAREYGVDKSTMSDAVHGRTWRHVP